MGTKHLDLRECPELLEDFSFTTKDGKKHTALPLISAQMDKIVKIGETEGYDDLNGVDKHILMISIITGENKSVFSQLTLPQARGITAGFQEDMLGPLDSDEEQDE